MALVPLVRTEPAAPAYEDRFWAPPAETAAPHPSKEESEPSELLRWLQASRGGIRYCMGKRMKEFKRLPEIKFEHVDVDQAGDELALELAGQGGQVVGQPSALRHPFSDLDEDNLRRLGEVLRRALDDGFSTSAADDEVWTPARVPGLCGKGVVAVAAGGAANSDAGHTVAVTAAGAVLCLGAGGLGQLGAGVDSSSTPLPVAVRKTAWS